MQIIKFITYKWVMSDGWMDRWMDLMSEWMDKWIDGWMDGKRDYYNNDRVKISIIKLQINI